MVAVAMQHPHNQPERGQGVTLSAVQHQQLIVPCGWSQLWPCWVSDTCVYKNCWHGLLLYGLVQDTNTSAKQVLLVLSVSV